MLPTNDTHTQDYYFTAWGGTHSLHSYHHSGWAQQHSHYSTDPVIIKQNLSIKCKNLENLPYGVRLAENVLLTLFSGDLGDLGSRKILQIAEYLNKNIVYKNHKMGICAFNYV